MSQSGFKVHFAFGYHMRLYVMNENKNIIS